MDALLNGTIIVVTGFGLLSVVFPVFGNRLYAPKAQYSFGTISSRTPVRHRFSIRNLHLWPVMVTSVQSDCGCTEVFPNRKPPFRLAPLQAAAIDVTFDTGGRHGHRSQTLLVKTSDNAQGTALTLTGDVN